MLWKAPIFKHFLALIYSQHPAPPRPCIPPPHPFSTLGPCRTGRRWAVSLLEHEGPNGQPRGRLPALSKGRRGAVALREGKTWRTTPQTASRPGLFYVGSWREGMIAAKQRRQQLHAGTVCVRQGKQTWLLQNLFKERWKPLQRLPGEVPANEQRAQPGERLFSFPPPLAHPLPPAPASDPGEGRLPAPAVIVITRWDCSDYIRF